LILAIALTGKEARPIARINYDAWGEFRYEDKLDKAPCKNEKFDDYLERLEGTRGFGRGNHNARAFGRHFGSKLTPYLYTGRRYSAFTNQYFNRHRYYSPALGRFTTKDPIGFNGGNNLYRYADNNPMRFIDTWGLTADDCKKEYKDLKINLIHIYNGSSIFPYDRFRIESSFDFVNSVSHFSIVDQPVQFNKTVGLIAWNNLTYNSATIEAFSMFSAPSNSNTEIVNVILAETNFGPALYGLASPIGGRRALVDWNNGQHLGNPVNRSWTITHESGHALGLQHKAGTVMQQANWGGGHFDTAEQTAIEQTLEKQ
jgi:RHS repeat-associated protein